MTAPSSSPSSFGPPAWMPRIASAANDILVDTTGHRVIDLFSGNGAAFLGHTNPRIAAAVQRQLSAVWLVGGLDTPAREQAAEKLNAVLPPSHAVAHFYSTGMEAAEFAIRLASVHTGRSDIVGFACGMHGKSMATSRLGWENDPPLPHVHRLPWFGDEPEAELLTRLEKLLTSRPVAAVFLEPILGSGGGHVASATFCKQLIALCRAHGALSVFDEILTGFHRTGPRFFLSTLPALPDVILLGKALGNGFPVSAVAARRDIPLNPAMLPGSTYAGNPLAAAAVAATLEEYSCLDLPALVGDIEQTVNTLRDVPNATLRGRGALWMLEVASPQRAAAVAHAIYRLGVLVSYTANFLRILPAATIARDHLQQACVHMRQAILEDAHG